MLGASPVFGGRGNAGPSPLSVVSGHALPLRRRCASPVADCQNGLARGSDDGREWRTRHDTRARMSAERTAHKSVDQRLGGDHTELSQKTQLVRDVPTCHQLAVDNAINADPGDRDRLASRGDAR